ncbi:MAG: tRNA lysidine(34) synthetase TilS [Lactobacillaceae bacterium]|jgi:tRNA(Ile)-lysidine synthase|nr:tRNA lysidine(34) synthetase TilS [Lactobacillaceae bacterium]
MENLETKFQKNLTKLLEQKSIKTEVFAVGVSGGADSLALVYLLIPWAKKNKKKLVVLTVEHGLRKESLDEALYVGELMKKSDVEHHILTWKGSKPKTGIEEAARLARYGLIEKYCMDNGIKYLMIAHHKFDQAETFIMRLQRGSGVDGLSAMSEVSRIGNLEVIRPLLDFEPEELKRYLKEKNISWMVDGSNYDEDFLRVRIRNLIPYLDEKIGLGVDRIAATSKVIARTKDYLEKQVKSFINNNVKFFGGKKAAKISLSLIQKQHEEMVFRILCQLIKDIADRTYIPRASDVERVVAAVTADGKAFKSRTLGGCEIINSDESLWIIPEIKDGKVLLKKDWDAFVERNPEYKKNKIPYKVRKFLKTIEF